MFPLIPQFEFDALRAALDALNDERAGLARQLAAIDAKIIALTADFAAKYGVNAPDATVSNGVGAIGTPKFTRTPGDSSVKEIQRAACDVLEERGVPMHRQEIYDAICARGIRVGGGDKLKNFGGHLSHEGRIRPLPDKRGYWAMRKWDTQDRTDTTNRLPFSTAA